MVSGWIICGIMDLVNISHFLLILTTPILYKLSFTGLVNDTDIGWDNVAFIEGDQTYSYNVDEDGNGLWRNPHFKRRLISN